MLRVRAEERPAAGECLEVFGGLVAGAVEPRRTAAAAMAGLGVADSQATVRGPGSGRPEELDSAELEAYITLGNGSSVAPPRTTVRTGRPESPRSDGEGGSGSNDEDDSEAEYNHKGVGPELGRSFKRSDAPPPSSSPDLNSVPRQARADTDLDRTRRSGAPPPSGQRKRDAASGSGSSGPARRASKRLATARVREEPSASEQEAARLLLALNK